MHWPLLRVKVAERSMEPALRPGDWLLVRRTRRVRAGQIVLARHPGRPDMLIVKRAARRVDGGWWLASDNPDAGAVDSRRFGAVPAALIEGRVLARYWRPRAAGLPRLRALYFPERTVVPGQPECRRPANASGPVSPTGPLALGVSRAQWCSPVSGSSSSPLCLPMSSSVSSRGREVASAQ